MKITIKAFLTIVLMFPLLVEAQYNSARITQINNDNNGSIEQTGSAQWAGIYQQGGWLFNGTNSAALSQNGSCNIAYVAQVQFLGCRDNSAEITQMNSNNLAIVVQIGSGNESSVVQDGLMIIISSYSVLGRNDIYRRI